MGYYIDLKAISIDDYKAILKTADLLPSRMVLKENIDPIFNILKTHKLETVEDLQNALKNNKKVQDFSNSTGIPEDYLKILVREINSSHPKPNLIKDFPGVAPDVAQKLETAGIKNTLQLFNRVLTPQSRADLSRQTGIEMDQLMKLTRLTDLSRIRWVNHTFAVVLLEAGYDSAEKVAGADYNALHQSVKALNEQRHFYQGNVGLHDIKLCVEAARDVSLDIEYR